MKKGLNKQERYYLSMLKANQYSGRGIYDAYKSPSSRKVKAYEEIAIECLRRGGSGLCVLNAGCQFFSVGYFYPDPETGELRACIELPTRTLDFAVVE